MKKFLKTIREKTIKEIEKEIRKQREVIAKLKLEIKVNPPKDTNLLKKERKKLAQLLTVLKEKKDEEAIKKELEIGKNKNI